MFIERRLKHQLSSKSVCDPLNLTNSKSLTDFLFHTPFDSCFYSRTWIVQILEATKLFSLDSFLNTITNCTEFRVNCLKKPHSKDFTANIKNVKPKKNIPKSI